jgi:hypothetical protein
MGKVKSDMKAALAAARGADAPPVMFVEDAEGEHPVGEPAGVAATAVDDHGIERDVVDVYGDFRTRFGLFVRIRNALVRQRIRAHVISGIEFMMFVFIVGPVADLIIGTTLVSAVLLAGFELLLIYKLWIATKTYTRQMAAVPSIPMQRVPEPEGVTAA